MPKLFRKTKRLVIRPLLISDYKAWKSTLLSCLSKQNEWDHGPLDIQDLSQAKFKELLKGQASRRKADSYFEFGVFLNSTGELVGHVSIMDVSRRVFQNAYLGYRIYNNHWRKGYGKEAVSACIDIGFKEIKLHRIEAGIAPKNRRSILLAKSLKMRPEGKKLRCLLLQGKWQDILIYALTCEDLKIKYQK
jgi:ribosomal-protein-alanine N-acetyltransferase